jgi:hypothetical protein
MLDSLMSLSTSQGIDGRLFQKRFFKILASFKVGFFSVPERPTYYSLAEFGMPRPTLRINWANSLASASARRFLVNRKILIFGHMCEYLMVAARSAFDDWQRLAEVASLNYICKDIINKWWIRGKSLFYP